MLFEHPEPVPHNRCGLRINDERFTVYPQYLLLEPGKLVLLQRAQQHFVFLHSVRAHGFDNRDASGGMRYQEFRYLLPLVRHHKGQLRHIQLADQQVDGEGRHKKRQYAVQRQVDRLKDDQRQHTQCV